MKLTTSFKLGPDGRHDAFSACEHIGLPLVRTHERAAAIAFYRNPDATHCIVSTKGERDAVSILRASKTEDEWQDIRERKGT